MKSLETNMEARVPTATYRLQFNSRFTFRHAADLVDYLDELGITDCYTSPLFTARRGSPHGYDVTDHATLNPEIGSEEEFIEFSQRLRKRGMGLILDVVPNHMCIAGSSNRWWNDVLENGPSSPYAQFFDPDWRPPKPDLKDKILLPMLGSQYGQALENQEIQVTYRKGAFFCNYYETRLPIAPRSYRQILDPALLEMKSVFDEHHAQILELESVITALAHLPRRDDINIDKVRERQREKEIIKRRIDALVKNCPVARRALEHSLRELNGVKGRPESFDRLERLLSDQAYRLSFWRVAADEINYRRFFDINELAAIRVEEPQVFAAVHELVLRLVERGLVTGLRIDHVDGLFDPAQYLCDLQAACDAVRRKATDGEFWERNPSYRGTEIGKPFYLIVEKILGHGELMRPHWPSHGTTGYGFLNLLNGVFVDMANEAGIRQGYERFTEAITDFADLIYECKKLILRVSMSSELYVLARRLDRISEQRRSSRDFTFNSLQYALGEVIACFPVYRSYTRLNQEEVCREDRRHILKAIGEAKRRNPATSPSIFEFIGSLLLLEDPAGLTPSQGAARRDFILRFQQLTSPVMAKGMEDTAFYRYFPLASLNEVGGEPRRFGIPIDDFHRLNAQRGFERPHGLSATSTHDTKRGEDVRARINVLSESPAAWYRAICHWETLNRPKKTMIDGNIVPDANIEYLLYQTLIGIWPFESTGVPVDAEFTRRIQEYLLKSMREAKTHTSWINPNEEYERATLKFIEEILKSDGSNQFLEVFSDFHQPIARAGIYNSLAQTLLKITAPGVPDFYQGTELWDFSLVDPDNRRPIDFGKRRESLASLSSDDSDLSDLVDQLIAHPQDGRIKLYLTRQALRFRRERRPLFANGAYLPLATRGSKENHVIAFARKLGDQIALALAARFFTRLGAGNQLPTGECVWGGFSCGDGSGVRRFISGRFHRASAIR